MMTIEEVAHLLATIVAYDNRNVGKAALAAWSEAARRGDWTSDEALNAVHAHFAESTEWLMPAHVTKAIRARREEVERLRRVPEWCGKCGSEWPDQRAKGNPRFRFHRDRATDERRMCTCHPDHPSRQQQAQISR